MFYICPNLYRNETALYTNYYCICTIHIIGLTSSLVISFIYVCENRVI